MNTHEQPIATRAGSGAVLGVTAGTDRPPATPGPVAQPRLVGTAAGPAEDRGYEHLHQLLITYVNLDDDDPRRAELRDHLVSGYLPLAGHIAARYRNRGEPYDDLCQVACIGLLNAINRYRPEHGCPFVGFAIPTITGEIRRHFRDTTWSMRVPRRLKDDNVAIRAAVGQLSSELGRAPRPSEIAERLSISTEDVLRALRAAESYHASSLDELLGSETGATARLDRLGGPDPALEMFEDTHSVAPALAALPERERSILIMRFYHDMTQTQIAERIGVSQMQVSRILTATLARLREAVDVEPTPVDPPPRPVRVPTATPIPAPAGRPLAHALTG